MRPHWFPLCCSLLVSGGVALTLLSPGPAAACGGFFCDNVGGVPQPVDQTGENILFVIDDVAGTVEAHIQIQYMGDPAKFAWVIPARSSTTGSTATATRKTRTRRRSSRSTWTRASTSRPPAWSTGQASTSFSRWSYYGVLASHHRLREHVIPKPAAPPSPPQLALDFALPSDPAESSPTSSPTPRRIGWAKLLARVFAQGVTRCRTCGGRMRVLEVVSDPGAIARILHGARAPPAPPPPGQLLLLP